MRRFWYWLGLMGGTMMLGACSTMGGVNLQTIQGTGNATTVDREVGSFSCIEIDLGADLALSQGDTTSLTITAQENLMDYITSSVNGNCLVIAVRDGYNVMSMVPIRLAVGFTTLDQVTVNGSSAITGAGLDLDRLTIVFNGSGSTQLSGSADTQTLELKGMANFGNQDLISQQVSVNISGSGSADVHAEDTLSVTITGTGDIRYSGSPTLTQSISGMGTITQVQ